MKYAICIDNSGQGFATYLKLGEVYEIKEIMSDNIYLKGSNTAWMRRRFILSNEKTLPGLQRLLYGLD